LFLGVSFGSAAMTAPPSARQMITDKGFFIILSPNSLRPDQRAVYSTPKQRLGRAPFRISDFLSSEILSGNSRRLIQAHAQIKRGARHVPNIDIFARSFSRPLRGHFERGSRLA
jgi:hypothetical protein